MFDLNFIILFIRRGDNLLDVQVDEFTLVLQPTIRLNNVEDWEHMALIMITKFIELSKVERTFGKLLNKTTSLPFGYSDGFVNNHPLYYFAIAYHVDFPQMGVCIKFSAVAWLEYRNRVKDLYKQTTQIYQFIAGVNKTAIYTSRLSRIDIAIDFINENVNVNSIYNQLAKGNHIVRNSTGRINNSKLTAITNDNITSTFYIGSKGKNIKSLLRVYDKKKEQIDTAGILYHQGLQFNSWVRFESVFKGSYAHQLTEQIKEIKTDTELKNLLVSALTDRYQFHYAKSNELTIYSKKMVSLLAKKNFSFSAPSPRVNLLEQSQKHILNGSGLFPYLYKVHAIWGDDGLENCLSFLQSEFEKYEPNNDVLIWINKYSEQYKKQGEPFKFKKE